MNKKEGNFLEDWYLNRNIVSPQAAALELITAARHAIAHIDVMNLKRLGHDAFVVGSRAKDLPDALNQLAVISQMFEEYCLHNQFDPFTLLSENTRFEENDIHSYLKIATHAPQHYTNKQ